MVTACRGSVDDFGLEFVLLVLKETGALVREFVKADLLEQFFEMFELRGDLNRKLALEKVAQTHGQHVED